MSGSEDAGSELGDLTPHFEHAEVEHPHPWEENNRQRQGAPATRRNKGRTVQAYAGVAVLQPGVPMDHHAPARNKASRQSDQFQPPAYPQYSQQQAPKATAYYPEVPRMSEDLYSGDQQHMGVRGTAPSMQGLYPGFKVYPPDTVKDAAAAVYPGHNVYPVVDDQYQPVWGNHDDGQGMVRAGGHGFPGAGGQRGAHLRASQQLPQPGPVVHMSKADAWARFTAYEACIQVCCDNSSQESAQHFRADGFRMLRDNLRIGCLLLNASAADQQEHAAGAGNMSGDRPDAVAADICWEDGTSIGAVTLPDSTQGSPSRTRPFCPDIGVRVRVGGILLPGTKVLDRMLRWAGKRQAAPDHSRGSERKKLVVYVNSPDGSPFLQCPLDPSGHPVMTGNSSWTYLEHSAGMLDVHVHSREGLLATAELSAESLWQVAQHLEVQEEVDGGWLFQDSDIGSAGAGGGKSCGSHHVPLTGNASTNLASAQLVMEVQRTRRVAEEVELLAEPAVPSANKAGALAFGTLQSDLGTTRAGNAGDQTMRMNRNIAYDCLLSAALEVERCGPGRLTIEGPWQWLLTAYADHYKVSNAYRVLVHMQWLLQPRIARTSQLCLSTICDSWSYLIACKHKGELSAHEDTMLTRIRRDVEELLKVAFVRYYVPQESGAHEDTPTRQFELQSWDAQHLQAAVLLYQEVAPFLMPSARDWLAQCWQTAAHKRWRALMAIGDPDRLLSGATEGAEKSPEPGAALGKALQSRKARPGSGMKAAGEVKVYGLVISLCKLIQEDITFDLNLKHEPGLLPPEPELPRKTAEEYCAQFLLILRLVLDTHPPALPAPHAVELLAAVAKMQRYLDVAGLQCDVQHPGHLNAFQLFQPHVLRWIAASQQRLSAQCGQLESAAKAQGANLMLGSSNSSALVSSMMKAVSAELRCYEQVLRHWPRFAPPLEAAVCQVLRVVLSALSRQCETAKGDAPHAAGPPPRNQRPGALGYAAAVTATTAANKWRAGPIGPGGARNAPVPGKPSNGAGVPGVNSAFHKRSATSVVDVSPRDVGPLMARRAPPGIGATAHNRNASALPQGAVNWDAGNMAMHRRQGVVGPATAGAAPGPASATSSPPPSGPPRVVVLLKEAVLLNSLKHIMVLVPEMEDDITQWATWSAGQAQLSSEGQLLPDGVDIGVHFAQLVKELRSGYAEAVAACAGRLAEVLRGMPATNIRVALEPTRMAAEQPQAYPAVSSAAAQKQALEEALSPVLVGIHEALGALQAALDTRVCIATGRALWDYVGKDLHLFVSALHERNEDSSTLPSAWRARQNADTAARRIDEAFCQTFTEMLNGAVQACDLAPPAHMDKVHKLLQRNNAVINMAFIPF